MLRTEIRRPLSIPKLKLHLTTNPNRNDIESVSSNNILNDIAEQLEKIIANISQNTEINDIISKLKNIITELYTAINDNNRKIIRSKNSSSTLRTENNSVPITEKYSNGNIYEGEIKNGKKEGHGIMRYSNGYIYEGEWKNGKREGKGIYRLINKDRYEGDFKNGKVEGNGISYYNNGDIYNGEFKNWNKEGKGSIFYYIEDHILKALSIKILLN